MDHTPSSKMAEHVVFAPSAPAKLALRSYASVSCQLYISATHIRNHSQPKVNLHDTGPTVTPSDTQYVYVAQYVCCPY
jgi:hypothetical protein